jgi:hypothetical protein
VHDRVTRDWRSVFLGYSRAIFLMRSVFKKGMGYGTVIVRGCCDGFSDVPESVNIRP